MAQAPPRLGSVCVRARGSPGSQNQLRPDDCASAINPPHGDGSCRSGQRQLGLSAGRSAANTTGSLAGAGKYLARSRAVRGAEMKLRLGRRSPRLVVLFASLAAMACSQEGATDTDCTSYTVTPEGGVTGFGAVGQLLTGAACLEYCEKGYTVCQLLPDDRVKCVIPCG